MEKITERPGTADTPTPHQHTSCWYRAATLTERLASWSISNVVHLLSESDESAEAEKTLRRWKAQKPFDSSPFFADRLALDALSEQDLLALLTEPVEALAKRLSSPAAPDWVTELVQALQIDPVSPPVSEQDRGYLLQKFTILQPFYPLLHRSILHLLAGIKDLSQHYNTLPFDPATVLSLLLPNLFRHIEFQVGKTLVLELNIARLRGHLRGETPEERFQDYLRLLSQRDYLQPFLEEYCVLARQVMLSSQLWAHCSLEFLQRLCADWPEILSVFLPLEQEPGVLVEVAGGAGDTHRGGHSVMTLTFNSGWRLLYKPKALTIDVHFQELLVWLNARGHHPAFRPLKLIDKTTYGWSEFIVAKGCSSEAEVTRFYERQGGYLALLYALEATDLHYENVIAAGEHPLLIDLEALFHPYPSRGGVVSSLAEHSIEHSVMRSSLLPLRIFSNEEGEGIDISGLAQVEGQLSPRPVPAWEGAGTDEMRLVRKRVELSGSQNLPRLDNREVPSLDYLDHFVTGFTAIYRLLVTYRDELLTIWLPRFAHDEVRFVARATRSYAVLLTESFHPNLLRDALKRERFFDRLWLAVEYRTSLARLIPAERADLLRGDIPLFTTRPESRDLWTSRGESLPAFFEQSSLELVSQRLQQLSEADLQRQVWMIHASFTNVAGQGISAAKAKCNLPSHLPAQSNHPSVSREPLLAEAQAIGDRLSSCALREGEHADWVGLIWLREREWQIAPAGLDLYSGLPGILFFLSYLGSITGEKHYTALAQAGLTSLRTLLKRSQTFLERGGIGAFTGLGSCIYLFSHLAVLWNELSFLGEAEELVQQLTSQVEKDDRYDLVDGAAGCIASLLSLYAVAPTDQILKVAVQCGEHLLACAQPVNENLGWKTKQQDVPLSGFSHGAAGIAWSLLRLAAVSGEERFRETAVAALAYEQSLFSVEQRNWRDVRKRPAASALEQREQAVQAEAARYGMSWSYGAPGIALGRLVSLPYLDEAIVCPQLEVALETTITNGFGYGHEQVGPNHSLAHGDCGNLETVLLAAHMLHTSHLYKHLERLSAQLLESMHRQGWVMGVPLNVETPGLMLGLAGIGYQCLRLTEPEQVPSVLTLAPPPATICLST